MVMAQSDVLASLEEGSEVKLTLRGEYEGLK